MDRVTTAVTVERPCEEVFDYLADIANHAEFMVPLFKDWHLTRVNSYGRGAGARFRSTARMDRFGWGELTFLDVQAPQRIVAAGRGGKYNRIETSWEWTLEPQGSGSTRVELVFESEPPLPTDKLVETLSGRRAWFRRGARKSLQQLRAILEQSPRGKRRGVRASVAGL